MAEEILGGVRLYQLLESGYRNLKKNMDAINALNVFPVPDGDTGTNMIKTLGGGIRAAQQNEDVGQYMQELSRHVLLSARGNSGVIFSQFFYGLGRGFSEKSTIVFSDFAHAFACATDDAYKSLLCPTEGTILTVIREASEFLTANAANYPDFATGFDAVLEQMKKTLAKTPDMLAVLKDAGVVDSGGAGLVCFVEGICAALHGEDIEEVPDLGDMLSQGATGSFGPDSVLEYGYCTEFILQLTNAKTDIAAFDLGEFVKPLEALGDSIVSVCNGSIVKIHIHSFTPEKVLEYGRRFGEFITLKIENMSVQHSEVEAAPKKEHLKYAIVAVASGEGIIEYFKSIGANEVIDGGQTCNPSVDAFLAAFDKFDAEHIIVLPNNSNIVLTAQQAAGLYEKADVRVIPTKSVVEGYSALSLMNPWCDTVEELLSDMTGNLENVTTGLVTTAIRDTNMDGLTVHKGDYIGMDRSHILCCGQNKVETAAALVANVTAKAEKEVFIIFYGANTTEDEANTLAQMLTDSYPLADVGVIAGKQDIYDFIISME